MSQVQSDRLRLVSWLALVALMATTVVYAGYSGRPARPVEPNVAAVDVVDAEVPLAIAKQAAPAVVVIDGRAVPLEQARGEAILAKSELRRAEDRLAWSERMVEKGFVRQASVEADRRTYSKARANWTRLTKKNPEVLRAVREWETQR